jgi:hypothetical protein
MFILILELIFFKSSIYETYLMATFHLCYKVHLQYILLCLDPHVLLKPLTSSQNVHVQ